MAQDQNAEAGFAAAHGSAKLPTRVELEAQINAIADDCAFTMPFWLAGMLQRECRRQGLTTVQYDGDDFRVTVKINQSRKDKALGGRRPTNASCATGAQQPANLSPNDPSSATRPTGRMDCNLDAMAGFAA